MTCEPEQLSAYLDGELSPKEARRLEVHLKTCRACGKELTLLQRTRCLTALVREDAKMHSMVMMSIRNEARTTHKPQSGRWWVYGVLAAAILLVLTGIWWRGAFEPGSDGTPVHQIVQLPEDSEAPAVLDDEQDASDEPTIGEREAPIVVAQIEALPQTSLPLELGGVVTGGATPLATVSNRETGVTRTVGIGDSILAGVTVAAIDKSGVVLDNQGRAEFLPYGDVTPSPPPPSIEGWWAMHFVFCDNDETDPWRDVTEGGKVAETDWEDGGGFRFVQPQPNRIELTDNSVYGTSTGEIIGNNVTLTFDVGDPEDFPEPFHGSFNEDFTELRLLGVFRDDPEWGRQTGVFRFTRVSDDLLQKAHTVDVCRDEFWKALSLLRQDAEANGGVFTESLDALFERNPDARELLGEQDGRHVTYFPGAESMTARIDDVGREWYYSETARLNEAKKKACNDTIPRIQTEAYWQERRANFEIGSSALTEILLDDDALCREVMGDELLGKTILEFRYDDPAITFKGSSNGGVLMTCPAKALGMTDEEQHRAQLGSCQNNMKQLGLVIRMFSVENREHVPASWRTVYPDYLCDPNVLVCPASDKLETCYDVVFPALHEEDLAMIFEAVEGENGTAASGGSWESRVPVVIEKHRHTVDTRVVRNVLFYDGHVEAVSDEQWNAQVKPYLEYR